MTDAPIDVVDRSSDTFLRAVELEEAQAQMFDVAFTAVPQYVPWPKAYGGDMVAQATAAAIRTVDTDRSLHSLHSTFLRPVDVGVPVRYEVELVRDGRGYSTRHVRAVQGGKTAFMSTASFQVPEQGPVFAPTLPDVVDPDSLPTSQACVEGFDGDAARYWAGGRSFEHRHVPGPLYFSVEGPQVPHQAVWVRAFDTLADDPALHQVALTYVCDYTILEPSLRVLGLHWSSPGLTTASLDHAMWFHAPARTDEWLLYVHEAVGVQSGRGLNTGRFFTREGVLVASVAQEGLIRQRPPSS